MGMVTEMHLRQAEEGAERFNYRGKHRYLVTLIARSSCGSIAQKETVNAALTLLHDCTRSHMFDLYAYCFLPDRLVLLIRGKDDAADMKAFLSAFRDTSSEAFRKERGVRLWTRKYQERVLRKTEDSRAVAEEIFRLPVKAGLAALPGGYEFQGSFVLLGARSLSRSVPKAPPNPSSHRRGRPSGPRPPGHER